jgi:hypothetical protein
MAKALIRAGSIVSVLGTPVRLCEDAVIDTSDKSLSRITRDADHGVTATVAEAPTKKVAPVLPVDLV